MAEMSMEEPWAVTSQGRSAVLSAIRPATSSLVWARVSLSSTYMDTPPPEAIIPLPCMAPTVSTSSISSSRPITVSLICRISSSVLSLGISMLTMICELSMEGMNAVPMDTAPTALTASSATAAARTNARWRRDQPSAFPYPAVKRSKSLWGLSTALRRVREASVGTRVMAMIRLAIREYAMVRPISVKSCREIPSVNTMGRKTQIVVRVEAVMAPATWDAPLTAAAAAGTPCARSR